MPMPNAHTCASYPAGLMLLPMPCLCLCLTPTPMPGTGACPRSTPMPQTHCHIPICLCFLPLALALQPAGTPPVFFPESVFYIKNTNDFHNLARKSIEYRCFSHESGSGKNTVHHPPSLFVFILFALARHPTMPLPYVYARYNFMPLARGTAASGYTALLALFWAADMPVTATIPPNYQVGALWLQSWARRVLCNDQLCSLY